MPSTRWLFSLVWIFGLLHLPSAFAMQQRDLFPTPSDYSLRMPHHSGKGFSYHEAPAAGGLNPMVLFKFKRLKDWQRPPGQKGEPTAIQFKCRRVDNTLEVDVSLLFGMIAQTRTLPESGLPAGTIGSFSLRLGESVVLQEMARYGIEPFEIKVVSANSKSVDPSRVNNRTKAIQVVKVEKARGHYRIAYKNVSSKTVVAMRLYFPTGEEPYGMLAGYDSQPLMKPGEIYEQEFSVPKGPSGKREAVRVTIAGVVFDDLTYEGQKENSFEMAARVRAKQIQWPKIVPMFKQAVATFAQDKQRAIATLKNDATALSIEPESSVIADLVKRYSPLTEYEISRLIYHLKSRFRDEKTHLLWRIDYGEKLEQTNGGIILDGGKSRHWLTAHSEGYEGGLRKLLSFGLLR